MTAKPEKDGLLVVAVNRQARHNYHILQTVEAGMELKGCEVKSLRQGAANLKEGYAHVDGAQVFLVDVHITPYAFAGGYAQPDPVRKRRLLLHKQEIRRLAAETQQQGFTLVPLRIYFKKGRAKVEIGVAKGKKLFDKRESIKKREASREMDRASKASRR